MIATLWEAASGKGVCVFVCVYVCVFACVCVKNLFHLTVPFFLYKNGDTLHLNVNLQNGEGGLNGRGKVVTRD